MNFSREGKIFLVSLEGICLQPYSDSVGVKTIGIGATISEIPDIATIPWDTGYTMAAVFALLDKSLKKYVDAVNAVVDVALLQHQFDALVSMCYNVGTGRVKARHGGIAGSTAVKRINAGSPIGTVPMGLMGTEDEEWNVSWITDRSIEQEEDIMFGAAKGTIVDAMLMWNKPSEIIGRRRREARLFANGNYGDGKAQLFPVNPITHKPLYRNSRIINVAEYL